MGRRFFLLAVSLVLVLMVAACDQSGEDETGTGDSLGVQNPGETPTAEEQSGGATNEPTPEATAEDETTGSTPAEAAGSTPAADPTPEEHESTGDEAYTAPEDAPGVPEVESMIDVTLVDYEIQIEGSLQAGTVVMELENESDQEHGLAVENADGNTLGMRTVAPNATEQLEVPLPPGEYVAYCPVGDHRDAQGMETEFTVE